jgi:hypothetical protein
MTTKFDIGDHIQSKTMCWANDNDETVHGEITRINIDERGAAYLVDELYWIEESDAEKVEV